MLRRLRFRPLGWLVAFGTLSAMVATMVAAAPSGAAGGEKTYTESFNVECVVAPGVLNIKAKEPLKVTLSATGPEEVEPGQVVTFHNATSTIISPVELTESFANLGANEVKGTDVRTTLNSTNTEPASMNIAKPPEFPTGLPFFAPVEKGKPATFHIPSHENFEGFTYNFAPETVKAGASGEVVSEVDHTAGFTETEPGVYKATGEGLVTEVEGRKSKEHVIGPLTTACTAPAGVIAARIPIKPPTGTTTTTTTSKPTTTTTTTTTTTKSTTTTTTTTTGLKVKFENWKLEGSLTDKKLNEKITLPPGCTFNGEAEVPGPLTGDTFCPPFKSTVKIFGLLPSTIGINFTESEPVKGSITPAKEGKLLFKATAKDNIGITSISLFGLTIPTSCQTSTPVVFPLESEAPASSLATGATFTGETTLPSVKCGGGFLGAIFGPVLTALFSGPNNPFTFTIHP